MNVDECGPYGVKAVMSKATEGDVRTSWGQDLI
jgi:hypothetical protein